MPNATSWASSAVAGWAGPFASLASVLAAGVSCATEAWSLFYLCGRAGSARNQKREPPPNAGRRRLREGAARASVLDLDRDEAAAAASALDEQQHLIAAAALRGGDGIRQFLRRRDLRAVRRDDQIGRANV